MEPRWSYLSFLVAFRWQLLRPGKQIFQEVHIGFIHMLRNLRQQVLQIFVDLQVICLGSLHQTIDGRTGFGTMDGINDMPVGSSNGERPDSCKC